MEEHTSINFSFTTFTEWDQSWCKKLNFREFIGGIAPHTEGYVKFYPNPDFSGTAKFNYTVTDGSDVATAVAGFEIKDPSPKINLSGESTLYTLKGNSYLEPGYI